MRSVMRTLAAFIFLIALLLMRLRKQDPRSGKPGLAWIATVLAVTALAGLLALNWLPAEGVAAWGPLCIGVLVPSVVTAIFVRDYAPASRNLVIASIGLSVLAGAAVIIMPALAGRNIAPIDVATGSSVLVATVLTVVFDRISKS